ncbi:MAG: preprotein translocase subunit YajC, partial [Alphaproteobacteria bacterium]|nr:preprotein translocase subunit YajC [Alphaproteobacteria bacterium]
MFISDAFAQTAGAAEPSIFQMFLPLILIGAVFYFLLIRPQQKKMKEHNAMLDAIRRGDRIVTGGGIV